MTRTYTGPIVAETASVYRCPISRRRYFTKRAAYVSLAKRMILDGCCCEPDVGLTCGIHSRLFVTDAWACDKCGSPEERQGATCWTCEQHGNHVVPCTTPGVGRYLKVKARLARWLMWRDSRRVGA